MEFRKPPRRSDVWRGPVASKLPWIAPEPLTDSVREFAADNGLTINRALSELVLVALEVGPLVRLVAPLEQLEDSTGREGERGTVR